MDPCFFYPIIMPTILDVSHCSFYSNLGDYKELKIWITVFSSSYSRCSENDPYAEDTSVENDDYYYDDDDGLLVDSDKKTTKEFVKALKSDNGNTFESQQYYPSPFVVSAEGKSKNKIVFYRETPGVEADDGLVQGMYESDPILRDSVGFARDHGIWQDGKKYKLKGEVVKFVHYTDKKKDEGGSGEDEERQRGLGRRFGSFLSRLFAGR